MLVGALLSAVLLCASMGAGQDSASGLNAAGVEHYRAGDWDAAVAAFDGAYGLAPENATVRRNLCNATQALANELARTNDFATASEHLERAIDIDPENHSPLLQLGSYYLRLDLIPEAICRLEDTIELAPTNVDAHDLLGNAYYMDNDVASALIQWQWVLDVAPGRPGLTAKVEKAMREGDVEHDFRHSGSRHFQLSYDPGIKGYSLRRVLNHLERAYVIVGRNFGRAYPPTPIQVIVYSAKGFTDATQVGEHVGALYDGKIRIPLLDASGKAIEDDDMKRRLYHEYTHVVVRLLGGNKVPWWLNEGLAETFSREFGDIQTSLFRKAEAASALFRLADLEGSQLTRLESPALRQAYVQSHATVHHLWTRFGHRRLLTLLADLESGVSAEDALYRNYRRTYESLQKEVARMVVR